MTPSEIDTRVNGVNERLEAGEPANVSVDTYSGYSGYKPQYVIDAMNAVFGYGNWGFEELSNEIAEGDKAALVISQVKVWLKDVSFTPTGWGQARVTKGDIGDAKKGAQTDALKKALSYFSIGNRAYMGLLPTDTKSQNNNNARSNGGVANPPARPTPAPAQKPVQPAPTQSQETSKTEPTPLNAIPSKGQLKRTLDAGKFVDDAGNAVDWDKFIELAFSQKISKDKSAHQKLLDVDWGPNYCEHAAKFLATLKKAA